MHIDGLSLLSVRVVFNKDPFIRESEPLGSNSYNSDIPVTVVNHDLTLLL